MKDKDSIAWKKIIKEVSEKMASLPNNLQNIHTPFDLCENIVDKMKEFCLLKENDNVGLGDKTFVVFNLEFIEVLAYDHGVPLKNIWFITDCKEKASILKHNRYKSVNVVVTDFLKWETDMKFDVTLFNPPYQSPKEKEHEGRGKCGKSLWEDFVEKAIDITKDNGFIGAIHPSRWRKPKSKIGEIIKTKQVIYLEMHGLEDGKKVFNCQTDYDWYILQNIGCHKETTIIDQNGEKVNLKICDAPFIPDTKIEEVMGLVAKEGEEKVELLHSYSAHETRQDWMSRDKNDEFKHPCIYSISIDNKVSYWHSSKKEQFFGIPKVVLANGHTGITIDKNGEYGLTQFAFGIAASPKNLENLAKALKSERFVKNIMGYKGQGGNAYDKNIIRLFKKDFWKEFAK